MGQIFSFKIDGDPHAQIIVAATRSNGRYSLTAFKQVLRDGEYHTIDRCSESSADAALIEAAQASVAAQLGADTALFLIQLGLFSAILSGQIAIGLNIASIYTCPLRLLFCDC